MYSMEYTLLGEHVDQISEDKKDEVKQVMRLMQQSAVAQLQSVTLNNVALVQRDYESDDSIQEPT